MSYELYWRRVAGALGSTDKVDLYLRPALEPWRERKKRAGDFLCFSEGSEKGKREEGKRKVLEVELGRWRYRVSGPCKSKKEACAP